MAGVRCKGKGGKKVCRIHETDMKKSEARAKAKSSLIGKAASTPAASKGSGKGKGSNGGGTSGAGTNGGGTSGGSGY